MSIPVLKFTSTAHRERTSCRDMKAGGGGLLPVCPGKRSGPAEWRRLGQRVPHPSVKQRLRSPPWVSPICRSQTQSSSSSPPISIWHHSSSPYRSAPENTLLSLHKRQNSHHCSIPIYLKGSQQALCLPRVKGSCAKHHPAGNKQQQTRCSEPFIQCKGMGKTLGCSRLHSGPMGKDEYCSPSGAVDSP